MREDERMGMAVVKLGPRQHWRRQSRSYRVIPGEGIPCPRCGEPTQIRKHLAITDRHLQQPYYFSRWFYCRNSHCAVTVHVTEEFKVRRAST